MMELKNINEKDIEVAQKEPTRLEIRQEAKENFFRKNAKELICLVIAFFIGGSFGTSGKYSESDYEEVIQVNEEYKATIEDKQGEIDGIKKEIVKIEEYLKK